jgi:hypothetical protein
MSTDTPADRRSSGHGVKSAAIRDRAVVALPSEPNLMAAARRCGVNEKTLRRWMAEDAAFKRALTNTTGVVSDEQAWDR